MKTVNEIRKDFLDFFESKHNHKIVPSAPVVPHDDPTLMFTNAGMNQFKDIFLGRKEAVSKRVADSQKIMRVAGKHNDLDEVGRDGTHHTFFEMLGNWSFGDYFKEGSIEMAWELITKVWGIPKEKLWVTCFKSDGQDGLDTDEEAIHFWKEKTDVAHDHIIQLGAKDNFWAMGDTGPCGPCSEIHYNLSDKTSFEDIEEALESEDFVEIWNLVFIQYNGKGAGKGYDPLPEKHVDTGMGLERITSILQNKKSNYDTDIFSPIIKKVEELSGKTYDQGEAGTPFRVIADHIRAVTFTLTDGVIPSNTGQGYVVRKILRRAARFGREIGLEDAFLFKIVPILVENMGEAYPELRDRQDSVIELVEAEEKRFKKTLDKGLITFNEYAEKAKAEGATMFSGQAAFDLYDRDGFPIDLTEVMARENGWEVDLIEFNDLMKKAKEIARSGGKFKVDMSKIGNDDEAWSVVNSGETEFIGYETIASSCKILQWQQSEDGLYFITIDKSPFYINSGGQVSDTGYLKNNNVTFEIKDAQIISNRKVLIADLVEGIFKPEEAFEAQVDLEKRIKIRNNHTATHLLHAALKEVLGDQVQQKGSLVDEDRLRFDFSYSKALTQDEIIDIENIVNSKIRANELVQTDLMDLEEAKKAGAMALFSEKYDNKVRVVSAGDSSKELCGGTHAKRLGDIGFLKIIKEESASAGVRRIEALAGLAAEAIISIQQRVVERVSRLLKINSEEELFVALEKLISDKSSLAKEIREIKSKAVIGSLDDFINDGDEMDGFKFICANLGDASNDEVMKALDTIKARAKSAIVLIATHKADSDKVGLTCGVTDDCIKNGHKAGVILKIAALVLGGKGGGRPNMAKGGGTDPSKIPDAFKAAKDSLKK